MTERQCACPDSETDGLPPCAYTHSTAPIRRSGPSVGRCDCGHKAECHVAAKETT